MGGWREKLALPPAGVLLLTLLFIALTQGAAVYALLQQPWTGIRVEPDAEAGFLRVVSVSANSPAEGKIQLGTVLTQIQGGGEVVPLTSKHFLFSFLHKNRAEFEVYLHWQAKAHAFLSAGTPVTFIALDGKKYDLFPQLKTPVRVIPAYFWLFLSVFSIVLLIGTFVWSYKPNLRVATFFFIACHSCYLFLLIGVTNAAREFFFPLQVAEWLFALELLFLNIYVPFLFIIISSYPHKLIGLLGQSVFFFAFSFHSLNFYFSWFDYSPHYLFLQSVLLFPLTAWVNQTQITRSIHDPVNKMAARLMQFSILVPFFLVIFVHVIPVILGSDAIISGHLAQIFLIVSFVGFAVGILRFRLFEVEYWWFKSWLWLLGGCLVVVMDMLLIGLLNTPQLYALGLSVMVTGFLYFPLRQWLLGKLIPMESQALQDFLPQFSGSLARADSPQAFEQSWQAVLQARFSPQHLARQAIPITQPELMENGLRLRVPALAGGEAFQLTGKHMASRLFNKADIKAVSALLDIARMACRASDAREQAVREERERLLHELQATVGDKLGKLADNLANPLHRKATEDALQTLESTVRLTLSAEPLGLQACLALWQAEISQRAALAGAQLDWRAALFEEYAFQPQQVFELSQFLHEAVSNALKHAHPPLLSVYFSLQAGCLQVSVGNDGEISPPGNWRAGTGMMGMARRLQRLNGSLQTRYQEQQGRVWLDASVPLMAGDVP